MTGTPDSNSGLARSGETAANRMHAENAAMSSSLGIDLARDLRMRWRRGQRPKAEELLDLHPELWQSPESAIEVIYEEFCLRQAAGEQNADQDILRRFPQWQSPLRVMLACHRVLQPYGALPQFPVAGDTVGGFRLVTEIGRGSRGRVWLAAEAGLADRPVVLKITPREGAEHLSLARLQHTNIVPVYSVSEDTDRRLRILCMPYFGCTTLATLMEELAPLPLEERTGQNIAAKIIENRSAPDVDELQAAPFRSSCASDGAAAVNSRSTSMPPVLQMLSRVSYVQATCWIAASLADALEYAHQRGLVHLDVKPSNVLLAADGQPMLLDFHLARETLRCGGLLPDTIGGTAAYMPPEQRQAMQAIQQSLAVAPTVDGRADIYALGAIVYELLSGGPPRMAVGRGENGDRISNQAVVARPAGLPTIARRESNEPTPLHVINPHVSVGLSDIVARCLSLCPDDRYLSAAALAEDLRRHLANDPLVGVPNRSVTERWTKWRRRRPNAFRTAGTMAAVTVATGLTLATVWHRTEERIREAKTALNAGLAQLDHAQHAQAVEAFDRGLRLMESIPYRRDLTAKLHEHRATARQLHAAGQLHELANQIRSIFGDERVASPRLQALADLCDEFWARRREIADSLHAHENPVVATDLLDVAICWAHLRVTLAPDRESAAARQAALQTLDEAKSMFGPSAVLEYQQHIYRGSAAGQVTLHEFAYHRDGAGRTANARGAWEHYALGRALLEAGDLRGATAKLEAAIAIDPTGLWPNFYYGLCAYRLGRYDDAVMAFSVCIGTNPKVAACFYNRALAYAALGRSDRANQDFDRATKLDPSRRRFE